MSDAPPGGRPWTLYVQDMLAACERIGSYTLGMDQSAFIADRLTYDATLRNIGVIGEAARRIPQSLLEAHAEVPWRAIIGARNRVIHAYMGIDDDVIWSIVRDDIPALVPLLEALLDTDAGDPPTSG